jgi:hypothetical protein
MQPKYNYHTIRDALKANHAMQLPVDINEPIKVFLTEINSDIGLLWLEKVQKYVQCSRIEISPKPFRGVTLEINADYGMCEGYDLFKIDENDHEIVREYTHIKNKNLDKRKLK